MIYPAIFALASLVRALPQGFPASVPDTNSTLSSSSAPAWAPTSTLAPGTSVGAPAPSAVSATGPYTGGDLTFYSPEQGGKATACGQMHKDTDTIAAIPQQFFDNYPGATANPNDSPLCGRQIVISAFPPQGAVVNITATVADICGGCNISTSVDVTPVLFSQVADQSVGRLHNISWDWLLAGASNSTGAPATGTTSLPAVPQGTDAGVPSQDTGASVPRRRSRRGQN
ncbi:hypothetical protein C8R44DRAFT_799200 [Mycena epipterygia]|nr:hypothetical protein C8R44DRAFT_799200 [Mycena epipterygia]